MSKFKPLVALLDYQAGNIKSVENALKYSGSEVIVTSDPDVIDRANAIVFPGQGSCVSSMANIKSKGLDLSIKKSIASGKPFLGVCLGLQLLLETSEEGDTECLGIIEGKVKRFQDGLKIPHMGWIEALVTLDHPVFSGIPEKNFFYFVHSYYALPTDIKLISSVTEYGIEFCSSIAYDNVIAVQFHPEKSGDIGLKLYKNFVNFIGF